MITTCPRTCARRPSLMTSPGSRSKLCGRTAKTSVSRFTTLSRPGRASSHVIGPELGYTQPGQTIVCGDSHTSTHGAFGALAFGIGTSEVEHVLATQTLRQQNPKTMEIRFCRRPAHRGWREGHDPRHHRPDRCRRGRRSCVRVHWTGYSRSQHGRPHDGLQHDHRGRGPAQA